MSDPSKSTQMTVSASYKSPTGAKQFQHVLTSPESTVDHKVDRESRTSYLKQLRASTKDLQNEINEFLTRKMDEDKKAGLEATKSGRNEEQEEENYGEEAGDDDTG